MPTFKLVSVHQWFNAIKDGSKTVEGRLNMPQLNIGDIIEFTSFGESVSVKVHRITDYFCFEELLDVEGTQKVLPGIVEKKHGVSIFNN